MNKMCTWVHCHNAEPTHEIPVSLASCNKQWLSVTSELQHSNVDSLLDPQGCIHNGPYFLREKNEHESDFGTRLMCFLQSWRLRRLPVQWLTFHFWILSINPFLITCEDAFHEVLIHFRLLKEISDDRQAVFLSLNGEDVTNEFRTNELHVQILHQNVLASSTLYANLWRIFTPC